MEQLPLIIGLICAGTALDAGTTPSAPDSACSDITQLQHGMFRIVGPALVTTMLVRGCLLACHATHHCAEWHVWTLHCVTPTVAAYMMSFLRLLLTSKCKCADMPLPAKTY